MPKGKSGTKKPVAKKGTGKSGTGTHKTRSGQGSKKRKLKLKQPKKLLRLVVIAALFALVIALLTAPKKAETGAEDQPKDVVSTGVNGVYIDGVNVSGKSLDSARTLVKAEQVQALSSIRMTLIYQDERFSLTSDDMGVTTDLEAVLEKAAQGEEKLPDGLFGTGANYYLTYSVDEAALEAALSSFAEHIAVSPEEPYALPSLNENNVQRFDFVSGKDGVQLDVTATAEAIAAKLKERSFTAELSPVVSPQPPTMSNEYIKENLKRRSTYSTRYRDSRSVETIANRVYNIEQAAGIINCQVIMPGAEWSFNGVVGKRTVEGGWKEANGISGGKEYTLQAGGGICQVSTTLYNALLCGNVEITDRKAHSIPSSYVPKGLDATVDSGGIDFKFKNNTAAPLYIFAYTKPDPENSRYSYITVSLYGEPLPEGVSYVARSEEKEIIERTDTKFTDDPAIPTGYQLEVVTRHDGYESEVFLDRLENGQVVESTPLHTDKYRGNVAEVKIGTGPATLPVPEGAVPVGYVDEDAETTGG